MQSFHRRKFEKHTHLCGIGIMYLIWSKELGLLGSIKLHSLSTQSLFLKNRKIHNICQILRASCMYIYIFIYMESYVYSVTRLYPTLCNPMDCSLPGSSVHEIFPGKNTGVGSLSLLQGIFPTQGLNPHLPPSPALQADSLLLSHQGVA